MGEAAEERLLECAQHDNQLIRMEAYLAMTKVGSDRLGAVILDRLTCVLSTHPLPSLYPVDFYGARAELDVMAEWIIHFGTLEQREAFAGLLGKLIADIEGSPLLFGDLQHSLVYGWGEWAVWRAASTQDERLLPALEGLRARLSPDRRIYEDRYVLRAQAACGSGEVSAIVVQQILDDEARILAEGQVPGTGSFASLGTFYYDGRSHYSLRVHVLWMRGMTYVLFPMSAQAGDLTIRSVLSDYEISDWYALYLLAGIRNPQASDKDLLMRIWASQDPDRRLLAIDVLYVWGDEQMLMDLYDQAGFAKVKSEIAWALATLKESGAAEIIEEQARDSWNAEWLSLGRTFIHPPDNSRSGRTVAEYLNEEMRRVEAALWDYFHPTSGLLDNEQLAVLKRLAGDNTIHAGMRFDLLGKDYGGTEWGLPLLEKAARDILAVDSSPATVQRITSMMKAVGNGGFMADFSKY